GDRPGQTDPRRHEPARFRRGERPVSRYSAVLVPMALAALLLLQAPGARGQEPAPSPVPPAAAEPPAPAPEGTTPKPPQVRTRKGFAIKITNPANNDFRFGRAEIDADVTSADPALVEKVEFFVEDR